jgi:NADH:ubiquinone oxidoreductase subunit K
MLNAASLNFLAFNYWVVEDPSIGQIVVLFIIGLAAAEAAVALSIVLAIYRSFRSADVSGLEEQKG